MMAICGYIQDRVKSREKEISLLMRLFSTNGVVVYGINIGNSSYTLDFPQFSNRNVTLYLVKEAYSGNLGSNLSTLNGEILNWAKHQPEAQLKGIVKTLPIVLPEYSQFFIVIGENKSKSSVFIVFSRSKAFQQS
jgi:ATP-dependent Zn protease